MSGPPPLDETLRALFREDAREPLSEERFGELAQAVFRHQFHRNPVYRAFCRGRGRTPDAVERWHDVPAVPATAFKELPLVSGDPDAAEAVFRTSGTTGGRGRRGEHRILDLSLYRASLLPPFRAHLLPEGGALPVLSLIPPPEAMPDSSLSYMVGVVAEEDGTRSAARWFVDPAGSLDAPGFARALEEAEAAGSPVLILATAFALVHWLDAAREEGWSFGLPPGSRIMETGGFKGRSRTVSRSELYDSLEAVLGVPAPWIVNEYGMTELLSQFYDQVAGREETGAPEGRWHRGPPWVRTRVLDPVTLEELPRGERGILCHFDLANLHSVSHVLTRDLGVARHGARIPAGAEGRVGEAEDEPVPPAGGFRVLGRTPGAEPRGCSRAMDELLGAAGEAAR